ncbi:MAG TPA: endolytic transglycosylase MltG [Candidatus Saccharimonadales bacterium]
MYKSGKKTRRVPRRVWFLLLSLVLLFIFGSIAVRKIYDERLKPVSDSATVQIFNIAPGSSVKQIADKLETKHLVRSSWATQLYVHSKGLNNSLQAGTYALSPNQSTPQIVGVISSGKITTDLVTILPGKRIDQISASLINDGYSPSQVSSALDPAQYADLPVMSFVPSGTKTLEGMLWPDSFERTATTPLSDIITESLNEMGQKLTPAVQASFASEGLSTYEGITLTSIVNQEVSKPADQTQVAQVFLSRLKAGSTLGSDVTANYGAIVAGNTPSLTYDSPYNTLIHTGLPPTPISTISQSSLYATTHPASTSWLYFVTGDDGTTYFSSTLAVQQANTAQYCHKLCSQQ